METIKKSLCLSVFAAALILLIADPVSAADPVKSYRRIGPAEVLGDGPNYIQVGAGVSNFNLDGNGYSGAGAVEARIGSKFMFLGPAIGFLANTDGGTFGYGGLYSDISFGKIVGTLLLAAGGYDRGGGKDLGGIFQFREEIAVSYQFSGMSRIGIMFSHISNAGFHDRNPGQNDILFTCSIPF